MTYHESIAASLHAILNGPSKLDRMIDDAANAGPSTVVRDACIELDLSRELERDIPNDDPRKPGAVLRLIAAVNHYATACSVDREAKRLAAKLNHGLA